LPGGELIDRFQNIVGNVADCQYLNSRPLPRWSNGSAISAAAAVIVLFIFIYLVHLISFSGNGGMKFRKKSKNFGVFIITDPMPARGSHD